MFIDSHCHLDRLDLTRYDDSLENALCAARDAGVRGFLCVGIGFDGVKQLFEINSMHEDVWLSVGLHPLDDCLDRDLTSIDTDLRHWCAKSEFHAVGETGLDYHYKPETRDQQIESFRIHLDVASEINKPVIVHTRSAQDDTLELIRAHGGKAGGVLHCFTESWEMAEQALELGYYISISGIVTFKNAAELREVVRRVPLERLLIETDSPYLAPVPKRGRPNDPSLLPYVAECVAELKQVDVSQLAEATTENFHRLFSTTLSK